MAQFIDYATQWAVRGSVLIQGLTQVYVTVYGGIFLYKYWNIVHFIMKFLYTLYEIMNWMYIFENIWNIWKYHANVSKLFKRLEQHRKSDASLL